MSKKDTKKTEKKAKVDTVPMTTILDDLLKKGGTLQEFVEKAKKEQESRAGNRYRTAKGILAHMVARASKKKDPVRYNVDLSKPDKITEETFVQAVAE